MAVNFSVLVCDKEDALCSCSRCHGHLLLRRVCFCSQEPLRRQACQQPPFLEALLRSLTILDDGIPGIERLAIGPNQVNILKYISCAK